MDYGVDTASLLAQPPGNAHDIAVLAAKKKALPRRLQAPAQRLEASAKKLDQALVKAGSRAPSQGAARRAVDVKTDLHCGVIDDVLAGFERLNPDEYPEV